MRRDRSPGTVHLATAKPTTVIGQGSWRQLMLGQVDPGSPFTAAWTRVKDNPSGKHPLDDAPNICQYTNFGYDLLEWIFLFFTGVLRFVSTENLF